MAATTCVQQGKWLVECLADLGMKTQMPMIVYEDNQAAIFIANQTVTAARSKHIDVRYHYLVDQVRNCGRLTLKTM